MLMLLVFLVSLAVSFFGSYICIALAKKFKIVDMPGSRSSHKTPKPRTGGIAIFFAFAVSFSMGLIWKNVGLTQTQLAGLVIGFVCFFIFGLLDDILKFKAPIKAFVPLIIIMLSIAMGMVIKTLTIPFFGRIELGVLSVPLTLLWVFFFTNIFNFMDGIDGLAAGFSSIVSLFLLIVAAITGNYLIMVIAIAILGSSLGFLKHNFPPARIFMGDSGSLFLGFLFSEILVLGEITNSIPFTVPALLFGVFVFDGAFTILLRLLQGKNIFLAHREHLYQRLLMAGFSHQKVSLINYAISVILGLFALTILLSVNLISFLVLIAGFMVLLLWAIYATNLEKSLFR